MVRRSQRSGIVHWGAVLVVVLVALPLAATAGAATVRKDAGSGSPVARLKVTKPSVEVRRNHKKRFRPAVDGQRLHKGDTIRTDATGLAEIDYTDDSLTRLDVETTFTIKRLTDKQGNRRIAGDLDVGRTWNRTAALTEAESFEMEGAGATAAVAGTAFVVQCSTSKTCVFLAIVDVTTVTGNEGVQQELGPGNAVDALNGRLGEMLTRTLDALVGDDWVQANLYLDLLRGIGPGPLVAATTSTTGGSPTTSPSVKPGCGKGDKNSPHEGGQPGC